MENGIDDGPTLAEITPDPPVLSRGKQLLPCALTIEERLAAAEKMALLVEQRDGLASDLREYAADMRDRIKRVEGEIAQVALRVRTGSEDRLVDTVTVAHMLDDARITYRADTNEQIASRPLSDRDRQQAFNFRDPSPEPAPVEGAESPA
jgi:hypothetical protein